MSRTNRSLPHNVRRENKTYEDYCVDWDGVHRGRKYAQDMYSYNKRLGRDGGYKSSVYPPYTHAPGFIDRWREDGVTGPIRKRDAKRELKRLVRNNGKDIIRKEVRRWECDL